MRQHRRGSTGRTTAAVLALALAAGVAGCALPPPRPAPPPSEFAAARPSPAGPREVGPAEVRQASFSNPGNPQPTATPAPPFAGAAEITAEQVVSEVLKRNPTLAQMTAAWQAASARYPQVTSLDDPRVGGFVGPASIGSRDVDFAYRFEVSQTIPYPGKRQLRGQWALYEAAAAGADVEDVRLQLAEAARAAFADYFLTARATDVNEENLKLLRGFRQNALSRFRTGQTSQQDVLQADVAIARQSERAVTLERQWKVAQARLNTLMHLPPDSPLPPTTKELDPTTTLPPAVELRNRAVGQRPDVAALEQRLAAEQAAVALALKEYKPDFEAMAGYDTFWQPQERDLRPMVGVRMNLPVRLQRRNAAVAEAQARVAQRTAELARLVDQVNFQVQEAYEQTAESERVLRLYEETTLPAARENVKLAQTEYAVGRVPFLNLIEAQRNLIELRDRYYEVTAEALRRRAALERAVGAPLVLPTPAPPTAAPPKLKEQDNPKPTPPAHRDAPIRPSPGGKGPPSGP